jgi:hypothetical protein
MSTFLGIYREPNCSPGRHRLNDATILELVAASLEAGGHTVSLTPAEQAPRFAKSASVVFSMSRSPRALALLDQWAREGRIVVNRPGAVLATARSHLVRRTLGTVSLPVSHVVPTARAMRPQMAAALSGDWWVKGGDLYASRREDVQRVTTAAALEQTLDDFAARGLESAVLQQHVRGREIKFYAVGGSGFFYWLDTDDPTAHGTSAEPFQRAAILAGTTLSLEVFGGDLVIGDDGRATLIDLNDWPSFAPCRDAAAAAIAHYLEQRARSYVAPSPAGSVIPSASA